MQVQLIITLSHAVNSVLDGAHQAFWILGLRGATVLAMALAGDIYSHMPFSRLHETPALQHEEAARTCDFCDANREEKVAKKIAHAHSTQTAHKPQRHLGHR